MSVYIDPRKAKKIEETPAPAETVEEWTEKIKAMDNETVGRKVAAAFGCTVYISSCFYVLLELDHGWHVWTTCIGLLEIIWFTSNGTSNF